MGLIRLLIIAALVYLVWRVVKSLLGERRRRGNVAGQSTQSQKMVKCQHCGVHVPANEAFQHNNMAFCSQDHQRQYLEHHEP